jgi:hypothetical protein
LLNESRAQYVVLMSNRDLPKEADALEWLSDHLSSIEKDYAGKWIAISGGAIAAFADSLAELMGVLQSQRIENPFLTEIPETPRTWYAAYANRKSV